MENKEKLGRSGLRAGTQKICAPLHLTWLPLIVACSEPAPTNPTDPTDPTTPATLADLLADHGVTTIDALRPEHGPRTDARIELGNLLFFDKILSGNRNISCGTCHFPFLHTVDAIAVSIGEGGTGVGADRQQAEGKFLRRNAQDLFNRAFISWDVMLWDGRVSGNAKDGYETPVGDALVPNLDNALAAQALFPLLDRDEMRGHEGDPNNELAAVSDDDPRAIWSAIAARLGAEPAYAPLFRAAYDIAPPEINIAHVANALAEAQNGIWGLPDAAWDDYLHGDDDAIDASAKRGATLFFGELGCANCHNGPFLSDQQFHNAAVPPTESEDASADPDLGRANITGITTDRYAFRTPPLRNVAFTGPWMHNGALTSLEETVRHCASPETSLRARTSPAIADDILASYESRPVFDLTDDQVSALIAFFDTLSSGTEIHTERDTTPNFFVPQEVPSGLPVDLL